MKNWSKIEIEPKNIVNSFNPSIIPLYLGITKNLEKLDPYGYALLHLNNLHYDKTFKKFETLKQIEICHNNNVSEYFGKLIPEIIIEIFEKTLIQDIGWFNDRIKNDLIIDMEKESIKMGALDPSVGLYTAYVIEYLMKRENDKIEDDLKIKNYTSENGWVFPILTSAYIDNKKILAKYIPGGHDNMKKLVSILNTQKYIDISETLKQFESEVKNIQKMYFDFVHDTEKIMIDFPALGLRGRCSIEEELEFKTILRNLKRRKQ